MCAQEQERAARKEKRSWSPKLRKHPIPGAPMRRSVFNGQQHRAAPLTAKSDPLAKSAQCQQNRSRIAKVMKRREAVRCRQSKAPCITSATTGLTCGHAVAVMAQKGRSDRSGQKGNAKHGQRGEHHHHRIARGKEKARKIRRRRWHECKNRKIQWWCRQGWRKGPAVACLRVCRRAHRGWRPRLARGVVRHSISDVGSGWGKLAC